MHRSPVPVPVPLSSDSRLERRIRKSLSIAHFNARHPAGLCLAFVSLCCVSPSPFASPFAACRVHYLRHVVHVKPTNRLRLIKVLCARFIPLRAALSFSLWVDWSIAILTSLSAFGNFLGDIYKGAQVKPPATSTLVLGRCVKFVISLSAPASGCLGGCRAVSSFAPETYFNVGQRRREM